LTVSSSNVKVSVYCLCTVDVVWCVSTTDAADDTGDTCHLSVCHVKHSSLPQTSHVSDCAQIVILNLLLWLSYILLSFTVYLDLCSNFYSDHTIYVTNVSSTSTSTTNVSNVMYLYYVHNILKTCLQFND